MCDLIVCCAISKNEKETDKLFKTLLSIKDIQFNNKYILFDGAPDKASTEQKDIYTSLKEVFVKNSHDFPVKVIENTENLYYKSMLEKFLME